MQNSRTTSSFPGYTLAGLLCFLVAAGCSTPKVGGFRSEDLKRWYVPSNVVGDRAAVPFEQVIFLDKAPSDRKYRVIGYVAPPTGKFRSWGEALNAVRAAASLYGANAVFLDSEKEVEGWGFSASQYGASGGKWRDVQIRAKAIVWER